MMDDVVIGNDCEACSGCGNVSKLLGADNTTILDQQENDSGKTYDTNYPFVGKKSIQKCIHCFIHFFVNPSELNSFF